MTDLRQLIVATVFGKEVSAHDLREIAGRTLAHRRRVARGLVQTGRWTEDEAERRVAPWKAIAVLCGVSTPQIDVHLSAFRRPLIHIAATGDKPRYDAELPENVARAMLATDTCSPIEWAAVLEEATAGAIAAMQANDTDANKQAAGDLIAISRALDVPTRRAAAPAPEQRKAA